MRSSFLSEYPPWSQRQTWLEAKKILEYLCKRHQENLGRARFWAFLIQKELRATSRLLDNLCAVTCPRCLNPCCHQARIWADFSDLVFWHLCRAAPPPAQLSFDEAKGCVYLGPKGCELKRSARPWVCTWYLCPEQKKLLKSLGPDWVWNWEQAVINIKIARKNMLEDFIAVCGRV